MVDRVTAEKRSQIMRAVKPRDTGPEMIVRRAAHRMGLRFRLYGKELPGKPDLVFPRWRTVVFVNGCFWHRHANCSKATTPKSNIEFWNEKFEKNVERDNNNYHILENLGWRVVVIWQCQIKDIDQATRILKGIFSPDGNP